MGILAKMKRVLVGEPLSHEMMAHERIPKWKALAVLSSDALSSVAYATEEILIPLAAVSAALTLYSLPIAIAIATLLIIVTISYRQTIDAYPSGGGAYIVAKENLGVTAGLVAGAALLIDYVLTVAVSVASGIENIISAFPDLLPHKVALGLVVIFILMILNLRGLKESASVFALPTYFFIGSFVVLIVTGFYKVMSGQVISAVPVMGQAYPEIALFLMLRAFASGCTALTGVEAISNGIPVFRSPAQKNAKVTLTWMVVILGTFFLGITVLAHIFGVIPDPEHGQTAISLLSKAIFGDSFFYYFVQGTTAAILLLAANTSYADFPRLASLLARDRYLPRQLASLGDRLVFSNGIMGLSLAAMFLVVLFDGTTHHLIPLYAVGVFLSFTLSQLGMVVHHIKFREPSWQRSLVVNALGALTTFIVLLVIGSTKFTHGAWVVILLIPIMVVFFKRIHQHYVVLGSQLSLEGMHPTKELAEIENTVLIPVSSLHKGVLDSITYSLSISSKVRAIYVELDPGAAQRLKDQWAVWAPKVELVVLKSPYRSVTAPLLEYIDELCLKANCGWVTVVIPEFVPARWWENFLHNQSALFIRTALMFRKGIVVTSVRYHVDE